MFILTFNLFTNPIWIEIFNNWGECFPSNIKNIHFNFPHGLFNCNEHGCISYHMIKKSRVSLIYKTQLRLKVYGCFCYQKEWHVQNLWKYFTYFKLKKLLVLSFQKIISKYVWFYFYALDKMSTKIKYPIHISCCHKKIKPGLPLRFCQCQIAWPCFQNQRTTTPLPAAYF